MKKKKSNFTAFLTAAITIAAIIIAVRHFHIKNFNTVKPDILYTSGQPRGMDYTRLLYKYHIASILNIRSASEHREENWHNEEITWVKNNGVKYIELPVEKESIVNGFPDIKVIEEFLKIMRDKNNLPVLLHDSSGKKRVAYLAAAWMLKSDEFSYEEIVKKVEEINGRPLDENERNFLNAFSQNSAN